MLVATQRDESWLRGLTRSKSSQGRGRHGHGVARLRRASPASPTLPAGSLSYGQRKLLELAYVLVADPDVILLDEPAGGVNLTLINEIAEKIRTLNAQGKTFLIVEHNMEFVMNLCDSVTVMHQGSQPGHGHAGRGARQSAGARRLPRRGRRRRGRGGRRWLSHAFLHLRRRRRRLRRRRRAEGRRLRRAPRRRHLHRRSERIGQVDAAQDRERPRCDPRLGEIWFKGENLVGKSPKEILQLGVVQVPQNHSLFREMTVEENVDLGAFLVRTRRSIASR